MFGLIGAIAVPFAIADSEVVDLPRASNDVDYQLYVHAPAQCREPESLCPVVYTLDAEYAFPLASTISQHLADRRRIRPVITVSIGYQDKSQYRPNRTRDYTPFSVEANGDDPNQRGSGGSPQFLAVIRDQIIPFVEGNWQASSKERTLVGHSYGGLFAANVLVGSDDLFANYIIVSPSLWYGDEEIFVRLDPLMQQDRNEVSRVYLAVGSFEEQPENGRPMVTQAARFAEALDVWGESNVIYRFEELDGETHASVFPSALSNGLRALFGPNS